MEKVRGCNIKHVETNKHNKLQLWVQEPFEKPQSFEQRCEKDFEGKPTFVPVEDGAWSPWLEWSPCSVSCSGGTRSRSRSCSNPAPFGGGNPCQGLEKLTELCRPEPCPCIRNFHFIFCWIFFNQALVLVGTLWPLLCSSELKKCPQWVMKNYQLIKKKPSEYF